MHGQFASVLSDGADDLNRSVRSTWLDSRMQVSVVENSELCARYLITIEKEFRHGSTVGGMMNRQAFWRFCRSRRLLLAMAAAIAATSALHAQNAGATAQNPDWSQVERALGRKGTINPGDVMKFSFPRSDLTVTLDGIQLKPAAGARIVGCVQADWWWVYDGHG